MGNSVDVYECPNSSGAAPDSGNCDSSNLPTGVSAWKGSYGIPCDTMNNYTMTSTALPSSTVGLGAVPETGWAFQKRPWGTCSPYMTARHNGQDLPPPFDFEVKGGSIWLNGQGSASGLTCARPAGNDCEPPPNWAMFRPARTEGVSRGPSCTAFLSRIRLDE